MPAREGGPTAHRDEGDEKDASALTSNAKSYSRLRLGATGHGRGSPICFDGSRPANGRNHDYRSFDDQPTIALSASDQFADPDAHPSRSDLDRIDFDSRRDGPLPVHAIRDDDLPEVDVRGRSCHIPREDLERNPRSRRPRPRLDGAHCKEQERKRARADSYESPCPLSLRSWSSRSLPAVGVADTRQGMEEGTKNVPKRGFRDQKRSQMAASIPVLRHCP